MKILDRRIRRLEAKLLKHSETEPVSDDSHSGLIMGMRRILGKCPRYNQCKHHISETMMHKQNNDEGDKT